MRLISVTMKEGVVMMRIHWDQCVFLGMILLVLGFWLPVSADAGVNRWSSIGPKGGDCLALAIDPAQPATLYAGTTDGVSKSTDGGATWQAAFPNL